MKDFIRIEFLSLLLLLSCNSKRTMDQVDYIRWASNPESELHNKKVVGDYTFISEYRPVDWMVLNELKDQPADAGKIDSVKKSYEGMDYFVLKIGTSDHANDMLSFGISGQQDYYNRVQYFTSAAQNDIYLVNDLDTIPCGLYHFERTYGISPYNNLLLGFERKSNGECTIGKKLHFNDQMLGNGMLIFTYPAEMINNIPQLAIQ